VSGPLQHELRGVADASTAFSRRRDTVAEQWRDEVYRSIDRRALIPITTELRQFQSSLSAVDTTLAKALRLLED